MMGANMTVLDSPPMGDVETTTAFGDALRVALRNAGQSQAWLGEEVARHLGRDEPLFQTVVSNWCVGRNEPSPMQVFAIEASLGLRGGSLSKYLGYLPLTAKEVRTPEEAIRADPSLPDAVRRALLSMMRELRK